MTLLAFFNPYNANCPPNWNYSSILQERQIWNLLMQLVADNSFTDQLKITFTTENTSLTRIVSTVVL